MLLVATMAPVPTSDHRDFQQVLRADGAGVVRTASRIATTPIRKQWPIYLLAQAAVAHDISPEQ
jgi:hypothetical protein